MHLLPPPLHLWCHLTFDPSRHRKCDVLIQSQARELSQLRQCQRQARGLSGVLMQQLNDVTKAFEELLRSNDVDFLSARSFREQLAHCAALLERVATKLSPHGRLNRLYRPSRTFKAFKMLLMFIDLLAYL